MREHSKCIPQFNLSRTETIMHTYLDIGYKTNGDRICRPCIIELRYTLPDASLDVTAEGCMRERRSCIHLSKKSNHVERDDVGESEC